MVRTIELDAAQATLGELIAALTPGEEIVIVQNKRPVTRILPPHQARPRFGGCRGLLTIVEEDEEHLNDFQEYKPP